MTCITYVIFRPSFVILDDDALVSLATGIMAAEAMLSTAAIARGGQCCNYCRGQKLQTKEQK